MKRTWWHDKVAYQIYQRVFMIRTMTELGISAVL